MLKPIESEASLGYIKYVQKFFLTRERENENKMVAVHIHKHKI